MTKFADRYEILGDLGSGGYGQVHRAHDHKLGREVALKLLSPGEETLAIAEAHALTHLESPHVLRVLNADSHQDVPFLATVIAEAGSAEDHLVEGVGVAPDSAVCWVRHALVGLDYCHRQRVLHRDIKPSNIFLQSIDHGLLGDFGVAVNIEDDGTAAVGGNQRVTAPEGFLTGRVTTRSDVFSAGVTLWRLLTGNWPYDAETVAELLILMQAGPRQLRDDAPHVPRSIALAVQGALDPDPLMRPARANDLAETLARCTQTPRRWRPVPPESGEDSRWSGDAPSGQVIVTATATGKNLEVETTRASGRRIQQGCFTVPIKKAPPKLRQLFDQL